MLDTLPRYTVTDLGILPGFEASRATALNDRGQVIGSLSDEGRDFDPHGFVWVDGIMRDLGKVWLKDINNKGQCVGAKHPKETTFRAVLYAANKFQELLNNTSAASMAYGINDNGQVVGYAQVLKWKSPACIKRGCFVWENGRRRYLDIPEGYRAGNAVAINNTGQIAGEVWSGNKSDAHACMWNADSITVFQEPAEFNRSETIDINNAGQILVRAFWTNFQELLAKASQGIEVTWTDGEDAIQEGLDALLESASAIPDDAWKHRQQYFLWQNGEVQAVEGIAEAVNDAGQVVGGSGYFPDAEGRQIPYAFIWQNGEMLDLNDLLSPHSGWRLARANDINNEGQIVGYGELGGKTRAFLLTPNNQATKRP